MSEIKTIAKPCKFMVYDKNGYHTCEILSAQCKDNVLCAWFYDLGNPTIHVTIKLGRIPWEKPEFKWEEPDRPEITEDDVPKLCPLGYTFKEIDARISLLNEKVFRSKEYIQRMKKFEKLLRNYQKKRGEKNE